MPDSVADQPPGEAPPSAEGEFHILPWFGEESVEDDGMFTILPVFGDDQAWIMGAEPRLNLVVGTTGADTVKLGGGALAVGAGGDDLFQLTSAGDVEGLENLGTILDFGAGDRLDLSGLGEAAAVLARAPGVGGFGQIVVIDFDGDGAADGYVSLFPEAAAPPLDDHQPLPIEVG